MSTKQNPSRFNCYEAAYPDETIFTLLARDPAFPATVRFWTAERIRLGKAGNEEDDARISGAIWDVGQAEAWREANLDPMGDGVPTWRLPRQIDMAAGLAGDTTFTFDGCEGAYTMSEIAEIIAQHEARVRDMLDAPVAEDPYKAMAEDIYRPAIETARKVAVGLGQVTDDMLGMARKLSSQVHRQLIEQFVDRINGYAAELHPERTVGKHPVLGMPYGGNETKGERVVIDEKPDDLAHSPEVPPHRFSTFVKGEHYAYARGLEVAPVHLPVTLDAMLIDGWELVSIFGQTESKHVGFIFKRLHQSFTLGTRIPDLVLVEMLKKNLPEIKAAMYDSDAPCPEFGRQQEP